MVMSVMIMDARKWEKILAIVYYLFVTIVDTCISY